MKFRDCHPERCERSRSDRDILRYAQNDKRAARSRIIQGYLAWLTVWWLPAAVFGNPVVDHVIHISVDGLRGDLVEALIGDFPAQYANFKRFVDEGATTFNARTDYTHTNTIPNHTSMLMGRPVLQPAGFPNTTHHGYINNGSPGGTDTLHNSGNPNLFYVVSTFDVVHDHGLSTALYASKSKFVIYEQSYDATSGAPDTTGPNNGMDKIDIYLQKSTGTPSNASNLHMDYLNDMAVNEFAYTFLHYRDPDSAGHNAGWGSVTWDNSVQNVDGYLADLFNLVETDAGLVDQTAIIVTSDHGGTGFGHGASTDPPNFTIPVLVWGPGMAAGADLYDLNSLTRRNPGTDRPDYTETVQPIRNGGTGNLALDLLGLGSMSGSFINSALDLTVVPELCDFDADGACGLSDIDEMFLQGNLVTGVSTTSATEKFDLVDDNVIDNLDLDEWLLQSALESGYTSPFLRGDTDGLNSIFDPNGPTRTVDVTDFENFLTGFTSDGSIWEVGNFDGDNDVDITDFATKFLPSFITTGGGTYGPGQSIPEPSAVLLLATGGVLLAYILGRESLAT